MTKYPRLAAVVCCLLASGCLVSDRVETIAISPSGEAHVTILSSNIHSTLPAERGAEQLTRYANEFDNRDTQEIERIAKAGGELLAAGWIAREAPRANYIHARLPDAGALESYFSSRDRSGRPVVAAQFEKEGTHRKLSFEVWLEKAGDFPTDDYRSLEAYQKRLAESLSTLRVVTVDGSITEVRGFVVADDRRSAIVDFGEVFTKLQQNDGRATFHLAWEIDARE